VQAGRNKSVARVSRTAQEWSQRQAALQAAGVAQAGTRTMAVCGEPEAWQQRQAGTAVAVVNAGTGTVRSPAVRSPAVLECRWQVYMGRQALVW